VYLWRGLFNLEKAAFYGHDCMDAGGRAPKVGALGDAGAVAEGCIYALEHKDVREGRLLSDTRPERPEFNGDVLTVTSRKGCLLAGNP